MSKKKILAILTGTATVATAIAAYEAKKKADKTTYEANLIEPIKKRKRGIYEKYIKRALDVICATGAIVVFSPVYLGVAVLVKLKLGSPVLFTQDRPGLIGKDGRETVFKMYKFRTMTDERDENGELLPDEARLTKFGKWLRNTSLDEAVKKIPKGHVATYGKVAEMAGNAKMSRAVGNALHKNPDPEHIPCFRVVNAKGELAGAFAFGGEQTQAKLLEEDGVEVIDGKVDLKKYGIEMI